MNFFSHDFVEMATFLACNSSAKLRILNQCQMRMRRLFDYSLGVFFLLPVKAITSCLFPCSYRGMLPREK